MNCGLGPCRRPWVTKPSLRTLSPGKGERINGFLSGPVTFVFFDLLGAESSSSTLNWQGQVSDGEPAHPKLI